MDREGLGGSYAIVSVVACKCVKHSLRRAVAFIVGSCSAVVIRVQMPAEEHDAIEHTVNAGQPPPTRSPLTAPSGPSAIALLFWVMVVSAFVAAVSFEPIDHGYLRYSAIAESMARVGDWIVPVHDGEMYVLKPPLFVWLIALPIRLLGTVESWMSHVPVVIGAALQLIATIRMGNRIFGSTRGGLLAGLILATMPEIASQWRGERIDPLFAGMLACAFDAAHEAITSAQSPLLRLLVRAAVFLALAVLTKGPAAVLFFALVVVPFARRQGRLSIFRSSAAIVAALVFLLVTLPWPLWFVHRVGLDAAIANVASAEFATRRAPPWEYLVRLPLALGPWTLLLPALVAWLRPTGTESKPRRVEFAAWWIALPALVLLVSPARHVRYLAPFLPAFALAIAGCLTDAAASTRVIGLARLALVAILGLGAVLGLAGALAVGVDALDIASWMPRGTEWTRAIVAVSALGISAMALRALRRPRLAGTCGALSAASVALAAFAVFDVLRASEYRSEYDRASIERAVATLPNHPSLVAYGLSEPRADLLQLMARRPIERVDTETLIAALAQRGPAPAIEIITSAAAAGKLARDPRVEVECLSQFVAWRDEKFDVLRVRRSGP